MTERNRVLVIPFTKTTKKDLEATLMTNSSAGWWDDSVYNTAKPQDLVIVVDNKTKDVLYKGYVMHTTTMESTIRWVRSQWEGHNPEKQILFIQKLPLPLKAKLGDFVTKTGRVQGTTLRYGK